MICTEKPLTQNKSLLDKKFNADRQQRLVASWKTVDGKLICEWVIAQQTTQKHNIKKKI